MSESLAIDVIAEPARAQVLLHPTRLQLLENLQVPSSAAALARRLGLPRQRVNYHLRELETQRLIELVEERRRGSCVERVYARTGKAYAISTAALGALGSRPDEIQDRFSAAYQIALAARAVEELAALDAGARAAKQKLPTLALEVEVRFASPEHRSSFADELTTAVAGLVRKYHDEQAPGGRAFRVFVGAYPKPKGPEPKAGAEGSAA